MEEKNSEKKERKMRDSGIPWIGEVPEGWGFPKITHILDYTHPYPIGDGDHGSIKATDYAEYGIPFIRVQNLGFATDLCLDNVVYISEAQNRTIQNSTLKPNDILFAKTGATIGKVGIVPESIKKANTTSHVGKITVSESIIPKYIFYVLSSNIGYRQFWDIAAQKSTRPELSIDEIKTIRVLLPKTKEEQQRIADYLDSKCSEIDTLIENLRARVESVKEYKKAIITEAVTKGLDKDAKMKDSGVEWIGKIPEGWKIKKIKYLIKQTKDGIKIGPFGSALSNKTLDNGDYNVYGQANLVNSDFATTKNTINQNTFNNLSSYEVIPGDICVSMMGTIGKCKVVPHNIHRGIMDSHLIKIRLNDNEMISEFFEYVYDKDNSSVCFTQMQYEKTGSIMDGLNTSIVKRIYLPTPPIPEQHRIADYLDSKCSEIDALLQNYEDQIATLEEYKKSLIYEYVTGKKEVPET